MLNSSKFSIRAVVGLMAAAGLVACANPTGGADHAQHHPEQSATTAAPGSSGAQAGMMGGSMMGSHGGSGMMGGATAGASEGMRPMDKDAMCAMYRSMRDAPNEQARQAMMDRQMQGMSPEMRQRHMEMMRQQCQ